MAALRMAFQAARVVCWSEGRRLCILAEENSAWGVLRLLWIGLGGPVVAERPVERAVRMGVTVGMGKGV